MRGISSGLDHRGVARHLSAGMHRKLGERVERPVPDQRSQVDRWARMVKVRKLGLDLASTEEHELEARLTSEKELAARENADAKALSEEVEERARTLRREAMGELKAGREKEKTLSLEAMESLTTANQSEAAILTKADEAEDLKLDANDVRMRAMNVVFEKEENLNESRKLFLGAEQYELDAKKTVRDMKAQHMQAQRKGDMETAGRMYKEVKEFGKEWVQNHKDMINKAKELKAYAENSEERRDEMLIEADKVLLQSEHATQRSLDLVVIAEEARHSAVRLSVEAATTLEDARNAAHWKSVVCVDIYRAEADFEAKRLEQSARDRIADAEGALALRQRYKDAAGHGVRDAIEQLHMLETGSSDAGSGEGLELPDSFLEEVEEEDLMALAELQEEEDEETEDSSQRARSEGVMSWKDQEALSDQVDLDMDRSHWPGLREDVTGRINRSIDDKYRKKEEWQREQEAQSDAVNLAKRLTAKHYHHDHEEVLREERKAVVWDLFGGNPIPSYLDEAWARVGLSGPPLDPSLQVIEAYERAKKTTPGFIDLTLWDGNLETFDAFKAEQLKLKEGYIKAAAAEAAAGKSGFDEDDKENQAVGRACGTRSLVSTPVVGSIRPGQLTPATSAPRPREPNQPHHTPGSAGTSVLGDIVSDMVAASGGARFSSDPLLSPPEGYGKARPQSALANSTGSMHRSHLSQQQDARRPQSALASPTKRMDPPDEEVPGGFELEQRRPATALEMRHGIGAARQGEAGTPGSPIQGDTENRATQKNKKEGVAREQLKKHPELTGFELRSEGGPIAEEVFKFYQNIPHIQLPRNYQPAHPRMQSEHANALARAADEYVTTALALPRPGSAQTASPGQSRPGTASRRRSVSSAGASGRKPLAECQRDSVENMVSGSPSTAGSPSKKGAKKEKSGMQKKLEKAKKELGLLDTVALILACLRSPRRWLDPACCNATFPNRRIASTCCLSNLTYLSAFKVEPEPIPPHLVQSHGGVPIPSWDRSKFLAKKMKDWRPGMKEPKAPKGWQEGMAGPRSHMCELCSQEKATLTCHDGCSVNTCAQCDAALHSSTAMASHHRGSDPTLVLHATHIHSIESGRHCMTDPPRLTRIALVQGRTVGRSTMRRRRVS